MRWNKPIARFSIARLSVPRVTRTNSTCLVLRFRQCKRFPYLVFYVEGAHPIDIWRVLHGSRDIPGWLQNEA